MANNPYISLLKIAWQYARQEKTLLVGICALYCRKHYFFSQSYLVRLVYRQNPAQRCGCAKRHMDLWDRLFAIALCRMDFSWYSTRNGTQFGF
jgi:hypothetical protein